MVKTVLYAEKLYDDDKVERDVFGSDVRVVWRDVGNLSELEERDCAEVDGLMVMRHVVTAEHLARFPQLACVVRMGVGYDKIDRKAAAARDVMVCNVPDYGTTEVADHALALALSLRRGIALGGRRSGDRQIADADRLRHKIALGCRRVAPASSQVQQ